MPTQGRLPGLPLVASPAEAPRSRQKTGEPCSGPKKPSRVGERATRSKVRSRRVRGGYRSTVCGGGIKSFVQEQLGEDWRVPTLWSGKGLPERHQRNWPLPHVVK